MTNRARASFAVVAALLASAGCSGGGSGGQEPLTCAGGQHECSGACVPDASPLTCGARCDPCPGTANGAAACTAGACALACDAGYEGCATGCCAIQPPAGAVQVEMAWPAAGAPLDTGVRLEVILPDRTEVLDAPATALTLEGLPAGLVGLRLRLLDAGGQVLARGGGAVEVTPMAPRWLPISTDASGLSGCDLVDALSGEDLVVAVSSTRTLTPYARDGWVALLLPPEALTWAVSGSGAASIDTVTGDLSGVAPGFVTVGLTCGVEVANAHATAAAGPPYHAGAVAFVRDPASADSAPVAALVADPPAADTDFTFRLDAAGTSDDGPAAALRWRFDWEGDGTWDTDFAARAVRFHQFGWPATYAPVVQVVDGAGLTGRATVSLPVAQPTGVRVSLDVKSALLWLISYREPVITATVTGAADTSVTWSVLEGAPEVAGGCLASSATTCTYGPPRFGGFYHLVATANADPAKRAIAEIEVRNQPPAADCHAEVGLGVWSDWAIQGQAVRVDGSRSRDPEGGALTYRWWYLEAGLEPAIPIDGTGSAVWVTFAGPGPRALWLEVTDGGGEVGSGTCGTVTWAPAAGIPIGASTPSAFWDDPDMTVEYAFTAAAGTPPSYGVAVCERDVANACWRRVATEGCWVEGAGLAAPYLSCAAGSRFVIGPESGVARLWRAESDSTWRPAQSASGRPVTQVETAVRGHDCLAGPFCP